MRAAQRALARGIALWGLLLGRMRARMLALRGARVGRKTSIGRHCRFDRPWCVEIGERVTIEDQVVFKVVDDGARVVVGDHAFLGRGCQLDVLALVCIGTHTVIAPQCFLVDHEHGLSGSRRVDEQSCTAAPVHVGSDVWLGVGVAVLAGATIGDGAVIGAHAVVKGAIAPQAIAVGIPARPMAMRAAAETA